MPVDPKEWSVVPEDVRTHAMGAAPEAAHAVLRDAGFYLDWLARCELLSTTLETIVGGYDWVRPEPRQH
jgi:hypothetical protein